MIGFGLGVWTVEGGSWLGLFSQLESSSWGLGLGLLLGRVTLRGTTHHRVFVWGCLPLGIHGKRFVAGPL